MAQLFRKAALDTMSTPEQLDKQVKIMRPSLWILYTAMVVGFITILIWSFTYRVTNNMTMDGIVYSNISVVNSSADRSCQVEDVLVENGEYVEVGDILAVVSAEDLLDQIRQENTALQILEEGTAEYQAKKAYIDGLVAEYGQKTVIRSICSGHVQHVKNMGNSLNTGDTIVSVMPDSGYAEVMAFVPLQDSKSLQVGMEAQISPSYAAREEYGFMTGIVTEVSSLPVTEDDLISRMGSLSYTEGILPEGACAEVKIRLDLDDESKNGYSWSNSKGESLNVEPGTSCNVQIVMEEFRPIDFLLE